MTMWRAARSIWAEPAVADPPARILRDRVFAVIVLVAGAVEAMMRTDLGWRPVALGLAVVLAVAVLIRRSSGLVAVALAFGAFLIADVVAFVVEAQPVMFYSGSVALVLVYSLFRWSAGRSIVLGVCIVVLEFIVSVNSEASGPVDAIGGAAVLLFAATLGAAIRYRAMARAQLVKQAKLHEREQLARELHDTVAHHVSAIVIQAQAGLVLARVSGPSGATDALETIEREAARTLTEMRSMVGALRDRENQATLAPQGRLADIESLAKRGGSLRVDVELNGDLTNLPPAVEGAIYRVVQESVTNAQRHAQLATRVEVTVFGDASGAQVTVSDDGAHITVPDPPGYGLIGMTERVSLLGGTLTAGPEPDRGWCVRAVLPHSVSAT